MDALREIKDQLPLTVLAIHNAHGTLCVNLSAPLGRYATSHVECLWGLDPINIYLRGEPLELEREDVQNPFANGRAAPKLTRSTAKLKRRI